MIAFLITRYVSGEEEVAAECLDERARRIKAAHQIKSREKCQGRKGDGMRKEGKGYVTRESLRDNQSRPSEEKRRQGEREKSRAMTEDPSLYIYI